MKASTLKFQRVTHWALGVALACAGTLASAADSITIVSSKMTEIPLYAAQDGVNQVGTLPASSLPMSASDEKNGFVLVNVGGKNVWIDSMNVKLSRKVAAGCGAIVSGSNNTKVAGELGAGTDRCK